jgi:quinol monooxygenase YgiN
MTDLVNIVLLRARVGKADFLGGALAELVVLTRQEAGSAICELNQSAADPNTWMVYERWRGKDAFDSHMRQPYVARFLAQLNDLVSEPPEVRPFHYRLLPAAPGGRG